MLARVKKDDIVCVLSGKDKGKQGAVIAVYPQRNEVLVKDVAVAVIHEKAKKAGEKSRISREERPIPLCKVMPVCVSCKKPCRVRVRILEDGGKTRVCVHCQEIF